MIVMMDSLRPSQPLDSSPHRDPFECDLTMRTDLERLGAEAGVQIEIVELRDQVTGEIVASNRVLFTRVVTNSVPVS
ncbi:hypothetical protein NHQ30_002272 [Ciborinia camelliae]|nr:hypothetical protein NHQ30_002272 [Ciborinia camelliae]